ncbi:MAG: methyltransferase domain-containing protein [Desulfobacterales bacterium]
MEEINCPLCGASHTKLLFKRPDYTHRISDVYFKVVRCVRCSFVYINPRPSESEIHAYYPNEFYDVHHSPEDTLAIKKEMLQAKLNKVDHLEPGRALDIGCGKGEFLHMMQQQEWKVSGVEFSSKPPNLFDIDIHYGDLDQAPFEPCSFDLITMWAVLEHVYRPVDMLKKVNSLLKNSGTAVILVPNFHSIPGRLMRHDDIPRHVNMFTKKTFKKIAALTGFGIQRFIFDNDVFSGSVRGVLNYLLKLASGERLDEIVKQNRMPGKWGEFSGNLNGRPSKIMQRLDRLDIRLTPIFDAVLCAIHFGFIMTVEMRKNRSV